MNDFYKFITWVSAMVGGVFIGIPSIVKMLLFVMFFDIVVGSIAAGSKGKLTKEKAFNGVGKKVVIICLLGLGYISVHSFGGAQLANGATQAIASFFIYTEAVSILENAVKTGVPIPDILKRAISAIALGEKLKE